MHIYRIEYKDGHSITVEAEKSIEIIKKYDLATKENITTRVIQLEEKE